jgi:hypothetical protein
MCPHLQRFLERSLHILHRPLVPPDTSCITTTVVIITTTTTTTTTVIIIIIIIIISSSSSITIAITITITIIITPRASQASERPPRPARSQTRPVQHSQPG